jgi:hypothetical protein
MPPYLPFLDAPQVLSMGLKALDLREWILIDDQFATQLAERRRLLAEQRDQVLAALPEAADGQREVLALLLDHLPARFPEVYRRKPGALANLATGERFLLDAFAEAPLELAGRLVQEDLCLMGKASDGYRLIAAVLCFPAHWRLADKLGRPLGAIHEPVPGFAERLAAPVDRFFATIRVERPVWRANWSVVDTPELFLPPEHRRHAPSICAERAGAQLWLRVERQTLRRLPRSGHVLFTIHTYVEPLAAALTAPGAARALAAQIRAMPDALAGYKGILPIRAPLLAYLEGGVESSSGPSAGG